MRKKEQGEEEKGKVVTIEENKQEVGEKKIE